MLDRKKLIGRRIKQLREAKNISQGEFAVAIGVSQAAVTQMETTGGVKAETLEKISSTYNVDLNWVVLGEGQMFKNSTNGINEIELKDEKQIASGNFAQSNVNNVTFWRDKASNLELEIKKRDSIIEALQTSVLLFDRNLREMREEILTQEEIKSNEKPVKEKK